MSIDPLLRCLVLHQVQRMKGEMTQETSYPDHTELVSTQDPVLVLIHPA